MQRSPLRPILVWTGSLTFIWVLLMACFRPRSTGRLSYTSVGEQLVTRVPAADCIEAYGVRGQQRLLLSYHSKRDLVHSGRCCLATDGNPPTGCPATGAAELGQAMGRDTPGDRSDHFHLYARRCQPVTAVILAGGLGRRMGGADKGLVDYQGRPLIEWALAALRPQVDQLVISANRNLDTYAVYGHRVVPDTLPDYPGPLAGVLAALQRWRPTGCWSRRATRPTCRQTLLHGCGRQRQQAERAAGRGGRDTRTHHHLLHCARRPASRSGHLSGERRTRSAALAGRVAVGCRAV